MKLLLDENLSRRLVPTLQEAFAGTRHLAHCQADRHGLPNVPLRASALAASPGQTAAPPGHR